MGNSESEPARKPEDEHSASDGEEAAPAALQEDASDDDDDDGSGGGGGGGRPASRVTVESAGAPRYSAAAATPPATPVKAAATPRAEGTAMDITRDNRAAVSSGHNISFYTPQGKVAGYEARYKNKPGAVFSPRKLLFQDESRRMMLLSPDRRNVVLTYDTETGTPLQEVRVKNMTSDLDLPLDQLVPVAKFDSLQASGVVEAAAVHKNSLFTVRIDPRENVQELVIDQKAEVQNLGVHFTSLGTTTSGQVAVGGNSGDVRLYSAPDPKSGWKRAKTTIAGLGVPVLGVDVSGDGEWLVWTTKDFLVLVNVAFEVDQVKHTAFEKSMPKDQAPYQMLLRIPEADAQSHGIEEVALTPAKFDNGPSLGGGVIEKWIVSSTGPFLVQWNFRQLANDYRDIQTGKKDSAVSRVRPVFKRMGATVIEKSFEYGGSTVVAALAEDVERMNLDQQS